MEAEVLGAGASTDAAPIPETFRVGPFDDPDRYEIGEPVEAGAEGILYRGRVVTPTSRLSLSVAVKALQPAYASRIEQWAARWRDQVELLRSLQIPGLVGVREGFVGPLPHREGAEVAGRNLYLVMNWVEGEALDHWVLHHRGIDVRNALKLLLPVAVAVDTMHGGQLTGSVPVVHRDIKPANILIGQSGSVLVDFGLTKGLSIGHPVGRAGTPGYIAPEVVAGGGYTPAADRYAFGATVFFILTGRHPPAAPKPQELRQLLEQAQLGGSSQGATIPPELVDRVVTMLDPDPLRRPAALANWIAQLRQSSLDDEVLTVRLAPPAPTRPAGARRSSPSAASTAGLAATGDATSAATTGRQTTGSGGTDVRDRAAQGGSASQGNPSESSGSSRSGHSGTPTFPGALGPAGIAGGVGITGPRLAEGRPPVPSYPASSLASTGLADHSTGLAGTSSGTGEGMTESSTTDDDAVGATGPESLAEAANGAAHRRGGAHVAAKRQPQHARHQRAIASRVALLILLAAFLPAVASDAVALAHSPTLSLAAGRRATPPRPDSAPPKATDPKRGFGGLTVLPNLFPGTPTSLPSIPTTTTGACYKSFSPSCGPVKWIPPVINAVLSFHVTYTPQNPTPGEMVTFTVDVTDPDDSPIVIVGSYYGDEGAGVASTGSGAPAVRSGCGNPYGTWPAPPPGVAGHIEQQEKYSYSKPGPYQVYFVATSGRTPTLCGTPDPYSSTGQSSVVTVNVADAPPPPSTTTSTTSTTTIPPATTTSTTVGSTSP